MILNNAGIPLYSQSYENGIECCSPDHNATLKLKQNQHLFSGFITALAGMATEFDADLKQMNMGVWDIYLEALEGLKTILVVKNEDDPEKQKGYRDLIKIIMHDFVSEFADRIRKFDGNVDIFKSFEYTLNDLDILEEGSIKTELCRACISEIKEMIEH